MEISEDMMIGLILSAGESRSCAMEAIRAARLAQWEDAAALLRRSDEAARECHNTQTLLTGKDEGCGRIPVSLIMVHAQDHIMNAMLCREMAEEIITLYREVHSLTLQKENAR